MILFVRFYKFFLWLYKVVYNKIYNTVSLKIVFVQNLTKVTLPQHGHIDKSHFLMFKEVYKIVQNKVNR